MTSFKKIIILEIKKYKTIKTKKRGYYVKQQNIILLTFNIFTEINNNISKVQK